MNSSSSPANSWDDQTAVQRQRIEINDEALTINGVRFDTCPKPHEITKALGLSAEKFDSFKAGVDWSTYQWHDVGILGVTEDHLVTEVQIWFGRERPSGTDATDLPRSPFKGTLTVWGSKLDSNSQIEELEKSKPGLPLKKYALNPDVTIYCSSYHEGCYGTSRSGGVSIAIESSHGALTKLRFAWPSLAVVKKAHGLFTLRPDERLLLLTVTYDYLAPKPLHPLIGMFFGNLSGFARDLTGTASQPILCITDQRLLAKDSDGQGTQWSLNEVLGAVLCKDVPASMIKEHPVRVTPREYAADSYYINNSGGPEGKNAQVVRLSFSNRSQTAFAYRCTADGFYTAGLLEDFIAQLNSAISRYGATAPPVTSASLQSADERRASHSDELSACPKCGTWLAPNSKICANPECGHAIVPFNWREKRCNACTKRISKFATKCPECGHPNMWLKRTGGVASILVLCAVAFQGVDSLANRNALFPLPLLSLGGAVLLRLSVGLLRKWYHSPFVRE